MVSEPYSMIEVSVITPTYQRRPFIAALIQIYQNQTYPKEKMEWIILDDGRDKVEDLFKEAAKTIPNVRYIYHPEKLRIGEKRNRLNQEAKGNIIIAMDDDDYYPPQRIQTVVDAFAKHPEIELAGSSKMFMYYMDTKKIYSIGPYGPNHATNGTMAWRKTYAERHMYDSFVTKGEEVSFLENYRHPLIQLDPFSSILVICHTDNTVDKTKLRKEHEQSRNLNRMVLTTYQLHDIVSDPTLQEFYEHLPVLLE
jgi:glycosyltransferase involved in cell wall biosynthesis